MTDTPEFEPNPLAVIGSNNPPKPERRKTTYRRRCPETNTVFETTVHDRLFSTDKAKADFHNRSSKVGRSLVPLALAWRAGRNIKGKDAKSRAYRATAASAFNGMCALLDDALREERESGRMTKIDYLRRRTNHEGGLSGPQSIAYQEREIAKEERALKAKKAALEAEKAALAAAAKEPKAA
jgi:hypothetical protein